MPIWFYRTLYCFYKFSDLIPKTPILSDAVEVAPEVVAKELECLGQDDTSLDDLDYCDSEQD